MYYIQANNLLYLKKINLKIQTRQCKKYKYNFSTHNKYILKSATVKHSYAAHWSALLKWEYHLGGE